jgi:hypothetical protein
MNRRTTLLVITVALAAYGLYAASYVPAMLVGTPVPLLLVGFVLQAAFAFAAAFAVWRDRRWAAGVLMLLGITIAATWLVEAVVLGIVAFLPALAVAAMAVIVTLAIAAYANASRAEGGSSQSR